jgi:hypothetical protein
MYFDTVKINLAPMVSLVSYSAIVIAAVCVVIWAIWRDRRAKRR